LLDPWLHPARCHATEYLMRRETLKGNNLQDLNRATARAMDDLLAKTILL
jgi:hypothetical protein